jgi:hypothetical protein
LWVEDVGCVVWCEVWCTDELWDDDLCDVWAVLVECWLDVAGVVEPGDEGDAAPGDEVAAGVEDVSVAGAGEAANAAAGRTRPSAANRHVREGITGWLRGQQALRKRLTGR